MADYALRTNSKLDVAPAEEWLDTSAESCAMRCSKSATCR